MIRMLAVILQIVGAGLVVAANAVLFGLVGGLLAGGTLVFVAGFALERDA